MNNSFNPSDVKKFGLSFNEMLELETTMQIPYNSQVSLRDALEVVPLFDGKNISLGSFIEGCEEAKQMLSQSDLVEEKLIKMIRGNLTGEARKEIYGTSFRKLSELINQLKKFIYQLNLFTYYKAS